MLSQCGITPLYNTRSRNRKRAKVKPNALNYRLRSKHFSRFKKELLRFSAWDQKHSGWVNLQHRLLGEMGHFCSTEPRPRVFSFIPFNRNNLAFKWTSLMVQALLPEKLSEFRAIEWGNEEEEFSLVCCAQTHSRARSPTKSETARSLL